jgi:hypothetical protein
LIIGEDKEDVGPTRGSQFSIPFHSNIDFNSLTSFGIVSRGPLTSCKYDSNATQPL